MESCKQNKHPVFSARHSSKLVEHLPDTEEYVTSTPSKMVAVWAGHILSNCTKPRNRPIDNAPTAHFTLQI